MSYAIRRASISDVFALNVLMHASKAYAGDYQAILEGYDIGTDQVMRDQMFVASDGEQILGFYSLSIEAFELNLMFIDDAAQGKGVGRALFEHMRHTAAAYGMAAVKIVSNPPARGFYERMGAVFSGISPPQGKVTWERPILFLQI